MLFSPYQCAICIFQLKVQYFLHTTLTSALASTDVKRTIRLSTSRVCLFSHFLISQDMLLPHINFNKHTWTKNYSSSPKAPFHPKLCFRPCCRQSRYRPRSHHDRGSRPAEMRDSRVLGYAGFCYPPAGMKGGGGFV